MNSKASPVMLVARRSSPPFDWALVSSLSLLLFCIAVSLTIGRYPISLWQLAQFICQGHGLAALSPQDSQLLSQIITNARLPRIIAAVLVGAGLSVSGAAYQGVFRNPLASPGLLGVLSGCAFGAAIGITLNLGGLWIPLLASIAGLLAVAVGVGLSNLFSSASMLTLVLGGIVSNALFSSLLSITKYMADPQDQLPAIVYWMLGSLSAVDRHALTLVGPVLLLSIVCMCLAGRAIDALSLSDDEAYSLGVPVRRIRYAVIILATLISALTVSLAGMIGWVGLIIPHLARLVVGPNNSRLLPVSACFGAVFLIVADALARTLSAGEIPLGTLTELLGALAFVMLLKRARRGWL